MVRKEGLSAMKKIMYPDGQIYHGDCLEVMRTLPESSIDLVFGSPPYESDTRTYGIGFNKPREEWIAWMIEVVEESLRVCKGLVAFVIGHGKGARQWSGTPALLCADLIRKGINLRSPVWYKRNGIMGSGGNDCLRADMEWIVCATNGKSKLPWSDNTACGHPPKFGPGGEPSYHGKNGRVNSNAHRYSKEDYQRINELVTTEKITRREAVKRLGLQTRVATTATPNGTIPDMYNPPEKANPGNVIDCGSVGGGRMGSNINYENEASFPLKLPLFFIKSFCPPNGVVLDPFGGSGTTIQAAIQTGRQFIACDIRESQIALMKRRVHQARRNKGLLCE
jgi:site-specific DNA-methyltransferase (adenine-specific)